MAGAPTNRISVTEYRLSMHIGICHGPVDYLTSLSIGDKLIWAGDTYNTPILINEPEVFGGVTKEGGVVGRMDVLPGDDTQLLPAEIASKFGSTPDNLPGFRGLLSVFFRSVDGHAKPGFYWSANSPYLKNPAFGVRRSPKGLSPVTAMIGTDANPAHIIYEALTNGVWGMGASPSSLDVGSFNYASAILLSEGLGLSLMWTGQSTIQSFIQEILDHIEGTFYLNPANGLFTLKLIRKDFDVSTLFHINEDNAQMLSFVRKGWGETVNEINASWTNPVNEQEENVTVHSLGNIAAQGQISSDGRNYYGVRSADLALRLAMRDLNAVSYPIASCDVAVDRSAWQQVPGAVVKVSWAKHGLLELPMRVGNINYGRPNNPKIVISLMEDVFALPDSTYVDAPGTGWEDPTTPPVPLEYLRLIDSPYYSVARLLGDAGAAALTYPQVYTTAMAAQPNTDTISVEMLSERPNNVGELDFRRVGTISLSGRALIAAPLSREAPTSQLPGLLNLFGSVAPEPGVLVCIGAVDPELAVVQEINETGPVLRRGVLDTVPKAWPANTVVWFFRPAGTIYDTFAHAAGETTSYKFLPRTSAGLLLESSAPEVDFTSSDRSHRPLRPANVKVNGTLFSPAAPVDLEADGLVITWANRNRLTETSQILGWTGANVTGEAGQTTTVVVKNLGGSVLETQTGLTGTTFTATFDPALVVGNVLSVEVWSVRDGLASFQKFTTTVSVV